MIQVEQLINNYLDITESYQLPEKMMTILLSDKKSELFDLILEHYPSLETDIFFEYFQEEHANRKGLKQDFTPDSICELIGRLTDKVETVYDVCSGTGGLSIKQINKNPEAEYYFEEISERTLPLLLFNLSIRNINAVVKLGDSLKREYKQYYKLEKGDKYSDITETNHIQEIKADLVITNPPYSLSWDQKEDERFEDYGLAPKSKADFAFILHGLSKLKDGGELYAILPHGILFRGGAEGKIRQKLVENNLIDTVIGLPDNMFLSTGIPTLILKLKKNRENTDILFIDAREQREEIKKYNVLTEKHLETIVGAVNMRRNIDKLATVVDLQELEENDYVLNIPRFVDITEYEPPPDLKKTMKEYIELSKEGARLEKEIFKMMGQIAGTDYDTEQELEEIREMIQLEMDI